MTRESQQRRAIQLLSDGATDERIRAEALGLAGERREQDKEQKQ